MAEGKKLVLREKPNRAHKPLALAGLACLFATTAAVDPTGISLVMFLCTSTSAVARASYEGVRKVVVTLLENDEPVNTSSDDQFNPVELEECVRKIASSITSIGISGLLATVLPQTLVGAALNVLEFTKELRKLWKMAASRGMRSRDLLRTISKLDIATQIVLGIAIKATFTVLFLGSDFEIWAKHIGHDLSSGGATAETIAKVLQDASHHYRDLTSHGILAATTAISHAPGDVVTEFLTGLHSSVTWKDHVGGGVILQIGAVNAVTDSMLSEEPVHQAVTSASKRGKPGTNHNAHR